MKQYWKNKWVKALRSGEYKQGYGRLRRTNEFCCLGVLTDLVVKENPDKFSEDVWKNNSRLVSIHGNSNVDESQTFLSNDVIQITGVDNCMGIYVVDNEPASLWYMNDLKLKSFNEIADIIEEHWERL